MRWKNRPLRIGNKVDKIRKFSILPDGFIRIEQKPEVNYRIETL